MDINTYKQGPRTAGISIFHEDLPKLASVHCYDRGAVATFGLQTCAPKRPVDTFPIRPIPNHISSKGVMMSQRLYGEQKRHLINPSKYSGTFFPPGSEPRIQFVDGRPIIISSTYGNKFIPRDCFDTSLDKSKSVIYNERAAMQYYNCCSQYASLNSVHKCPDDMIKRSLPSCMPDLTYNCPYTVENDNVTRRGYSMQEYDTVKPTYGPTPSESALQQREMYLQQQQQLQSSKAPVPSIYPQQRETHMLPQPYRTAANEYEKNAHPAAAAVRPVMINVESMAEPKTKSVTVNDSSPNNIRREANHFVRSSSYNSIELKDRDYDSVVSPRHHSDNMDSPSLQRNSNPSMRAVRSSTRCNACQKELGTNETGVYNNRTSTLLCQQCANKNRMWGSMKNLPDDCLTTKPRTCDSNENIREETRCCKSADCVNRSYSSPLISETSRQHCHSNGTTKTPIVIEIDETNEEETNKNCNSVETNRPRSTDDSCTPITPRKPPCLKCLRKNQNRSLKRFSPKEGVINSDGTPAKPIVINLDDDEEEKTGDKTCVSPSLKIKSEVSNENTSNENSNKANENFDLTLDIDEKSFDSFINNNVEDETIFDVEKVRTPVDEVNMMAINDRTNVDNSRENIVDNQKMQDHQFDEITRKRKMNCPSLPNLDCHVEQEAFRDTKSYPPSPTYLIDESQLQMLRNTIVPVLKAKKWIRGNSEDNGSS